MESSENPNSKPLSVGRENIKNTRHATLSVHNSHLMSVMRDIITKLKYHYDIGAWEVVAEELVEDDGISLLCTVWCDNMPVLPLHKKYKIKDNHDELVESWKDHYKEFVKFINNGGIRTFTQRLEFALSKRKADFSSEPLRRQLGSEPSNRLCGSSDGVRKKLGGETGD